MKKWNVSIPVYACALVTVEAETKEAAIEKGMEEMSHSLCRFCARDFEINDVNEDVEAYATEVDE